MSEEPTPYQTDRDSGDETTEHHPPAVAPLPAMQPPGDWVLIPRAEYAALRTALRPLALLLITAQMQESRIYVSWEGLVVGNIRAARAALALGEPPR